VNKSYAKILTKNDTGETGAHQAGITVPKKNKELIDFFPNLDLGEFNPDIRIICTDPDGDQWEMRYVYYNGKTFSPAKNTRNEYRITYMTKFFSKWKAKSGDSVVFTATNKTNSYNISIKPRVEHSDKINITNGRSTIVLKGWRSVF
jgi:hypothetical protein